jgi:hypothetical protein
MRKAHCMDCIENLCETTIVFAVIAACISSFLSM